ncbi:MAG TPA: glycosyltransferase [Thermoanaerobaculia bacterium]|nr:glycosyltransferase [Thermoanaerobaculia bacterium]
MAAAPAISVILPCYRGAALARRSVSELEGYLPTAFPSWEIVVVDDGGGDFDSSWASEGPIRLVRLPRNLGKGGAVRAGMLAATGSVRLFTDVDLPYDLDLIAAAYHYIVDRGFHLAVGDRTLPGSSYALVIRWQRRLASGLFSRFVGTFLTGGFFDTQCGFKAFRADVAEEIFRLARIERFAFDVELLYLALLYRLDIKRVPVVLRNNETSAVRLVRDSLRMLGDVVRVRWARHRGQYLSPTLSAIVSQDFDSVRHLERSR